MLCHLSLELNQVQHLKLFIITAIAVPLVCDSDCSHLSVTQNTLLTSYCLTHVDVMKLLLPADILTEGTTGHFSQTVSFHNTHNKNSKVDLKTLVNRAPTNKTSIFKVQHFFYPLKPKKTSHMKDVETSKQVNMDR